MQYVTEEEYRALPHYNANLSLEYNIRLDRLPFRPDEVKACALMVRDVEQFIQTLEAYAWRWQYDPASLWRDANAEDGMIHYTFEGREQK